MYKETNRKLAEFALTKEVCNLQHPCEGGHYIDDDGNVFYGIYDLPNFPESFDFCIKHLVPKLKEKLGLLYIYFDAPYVQEEGWYCRISSDYSGEMLAWSAKGNDMSHSFCLATEKFIDGGNYG